jgi:hypothetical protein
MSEPDALCFTCGHSVATNLFANRLANGAPCPTCRDRLLDELPAPLPRLVVEDDAVQGAMSTAGEETVGSTTDSEPERIAANRARMHIVEPSPFDPSMDGEDDPIGA